jgi:hypothetical protein
MMALTEDQRDLLARSPGTSRRARCYRARSWLGFRGKDASARRVLCSNPEKPGVVQDFQATDRERMRLGKLGHDRPEAAEPARLFQEVPDVNLFVDVSSGSEQHQSLFAPRCQVRAVPVAGELPGSREETS